MPPCSIWDVVKVPFPYTSRPVCQRRPALVIARPDCSETPELLWVLMITSHTNRSWPGDVRVSDLAPAGLPAPSVVRTSKIATIEPADAERIGHLPEPDRQEVATHLQTTLTAAFG